MVYETFLNKMRGKSMHYTVALGEENRSDG